MEYEKMNPFRKIEKEEMLSSIKFFKNIRKLFRQIQMELKINNITKSNPQMSISIPDKKPAKINLVVHISQIKCKIRCKLNDGVDDINFYLLVKAGEAGKEYRRKLENYGFIRKGKSGRYVYMKYPDSRKFFDDDADEQKEKIINFYIKNLKFVKNGLPG